MMEIEVPVKDGFLLFPPHGILKKKSWPKKYCKLFKASKHGIERLEVFETEEDGNKNKSSIIITLENCVKISPTPQKHQDNAFTIVTKTQLQSFATQHYQEMLDWISSFQAVAFKDGFKDDMPGSSWHLLSEDFEEDNELYCSSGDGVFTVRVVPTPTSTRCGLSDGNYTLVVTQNALQLRSLYPTERVLYTWPFMYIRKYGYKSGLFTFEAGRKCGSGEGTFQLENQQQQEIFKCISMSMKSWRKMVYKDDVPLSPLLASTSPPGIACGDGQFQAALSMEPGSRTPLPPSPTTSSNRCIDELSLVLENAHIKPRPAKPPRTKSIPCDSIDPQLYKKLSQDRLDVGSSQASYDAIEIRQEAWKTLGIGELTHTENVRHQEKNKPKVSQASDETIHISRKIINQPTIDADAPENYDTLQHFGSSQPVSIKSTGSSNSLYRQITPQVTTPTAPPSYDCSFNEYDTIEEFRQSVRPADDSHQGYGVIRKNVPPIPPPPQGNEEYAVVVKPKKA
ncbi:hypothetical protein B566_EDAN005846 [Ephemera danica]|nr:hypothetical protein B566_EDAN005846 [Ephemera danica]